MEASTPDWSVSWMAIFMTPYTSTLDVAAKAGAAKAPATARAIRDFFMFILLSG
jgi:hypothetical protein